MNMVFTRPQNSRKTLLKRFFKIYTPVICIIFLFSWGIYYFQHIKTQEDVLRAQQVTLVAMEKQLIQNTLQSIISDVKIMAYDQDVHDLIRVKLQKDVSRLPAEFISFSKYKGIYDQVRILDKTGREALRIDLKGDESFIVPEDKLQFKGNRYYFKDAYKLNKGEVFMSPLDLNIERGQVETPIKPMIRFCTPLFNEAREKMGVLILNYLGDKLINNIGTLSPSTPDSIMLINADGYFLKSIHPEDEWGFMFAERKNLTLKNRHPAVWQKIIEENSGQIHTKDGIFTFDKIHPLQEGIKSSSGSPMPFEASVRDLTTDEYYWTILSHVLPHQLHGAGDKFASILVLIDSILLIFLGFVFWKLVLANAAKLDAENELKNKNIELEEKVALRTEELRKRTYDLGERLKELNCLYVISELIAREGSLKKIIQETTTIIPLSWQYPEIACAQIILKDQKFTTDNFKKTAWQQTSDITVHSDIIGTVVVGYLKEMPEENEGPFLKEERDLLTAITARLGETVEHRQIGKDKELLESQLWQSQKMEAIGTLAGGIAHDFNNILSAIFGYTGFAVENIPEGSSAQDDLKQVLLAANRAKDLVYQILSFSRQATQEIKLLKIQDIIKESLKLLRASIPSTVEINQNIDVQCGTIISDPTQIHQVLMNFCTNAVHAMNETGVIGINLREVTLNAKDIAHKPELVPGSYACLSISDTGIGMDPKTINRIFEPFYTTKEIDKGTGLGLSVIHGIVETHKGMITVDSELGKGSIFQVFFPRVDGVKSVSPSISGPLPTGRERILLVDDEESILSMAKRMLESLGYDVVAKSSSVEALETFKNKPDQFDLVITDQTMPNMSGEELIAELLRIKPDLSVILCTGYSSKVSKRNALKKGINKYIPKPFSKELLSEAVREVLATKVQSTK